MWEHLKAFSRMKKTLFENFQEKLSSLSTEEKAKLLNEYFQECDAEKCWYEFDEDFFNALYANKPMEAARAAVMGGIDFKHKYIRIDAYGNLQSCNIKHIAFELFHYEEEVFESDLWQKYFTL
jgi:hypothetical protein